MFDFDSMFDSVEAAFKSFEVEQPNSPMVAVYRAELLELKSKLSNRDLKQTSSDDLLHAVSLLRETAEMIFRFEELRRKGE